jgi:hypothetical protein
MLKAGKAHLLAGDSLQEIIQVLTLWGTYLIFLWGRI